MPPSRSKVLKAVAVELTSKKGGKGPSKRSAKNLVKEENYRPKKVKKSIPIEESEEQAALTTKKRVTENCVIEKRLNNSFFDTPCIELAKRLLGKILVRKHTDGSLIKGKIIETECYAGGDDKASCSYGGKVTPKNKPTFMKPGTAFVYMTYGMYHCINISSRGDGAAVLLRALEPVEGIDTITANRQNFGNKKDTNKKKEFKITELCNGPSKLCIGFNIDKAKVNEKDLCSWNEMWLEGDNSTDISDEHIVISKRIGIDMVGEPWASKPLRFYIYESAQYVSKRDKKNEGLIKEKV